MKKTNVTENSPLLEWTKKLKTLVTERPDSTVDNLSAIAQKNLRNSLFSVSSDLAELVEDLDPIKQPKSLFDPANPEAIGRVVAMALLSQPKVNLWEVPRFYGSGIYAIYYNGNFEPYSYLSGKDHPIYVGKADPAVANARTPTEQGEKLCKRLKEHFKSVQKATNLEQEDFTCRFLVVASGWQEAAEKYLINLYKPIWNKETKICYGIGKHGDSADTRGNKRSPWDTMHSGRKWAGNTVTDQFSEEKIVELIKEHFKKNPPINSREDALDIFLAAMCQYAQK